MIKCPECGEEAMEGALLCDNCGTYFQTGGHLSTDPLEEWEGRVPSSFEKPDFDTVPMGATLILRGVTDDREIIVPRRLSSALIGRNDRLAGLLVDIDLTSQEGKTFGVSRRHARIRFVNERFLLEDLESLNGTYLNGRKLVPFIPEVLHDNDELRFGSLKLSVVLRIPDGGDDDDAESTRETRELKSDED